jgi:ABC-type branched-subunit amino acid transport system ATPase component/ABC-type branched-subunit amino acid transport system permease subunit
VILAPFITLDSLTLTFLVVAAFGAAAIGAFTSLPGTYLGGLVIGVLASLATKWFTSGALAGLSTALPFLVLFVVLMIGPRRWLAERAPVVPRGHAAWTAPWQVQLPAGLGLLVLLAFVPSFAGLHLQDWTSSVAVAIMYLSLGLLVRTSGQVSLCHVSFMAIGACGFSQLAVAHGWPWGLALITAGLIAVPIGALLSIPSIRLSGLYLALSTFGFGILLQYMFYSQNYMFGTLGLGITIPMPHLPGIGLNGSDKSYYYLVLILGAASTALVIAINRSRLGRLLRGLADSPTGLATSGTSVNVTRVLVFCISAFLAAIAGALQGGAYGTVDAPSYQPITSLVYFTLIIITPGGVPWYAVVAAAGTIIPSYLTSPNTSNWLQLAFGLGVLIYAITPQSRLGTPVPVQNAIDRMTRRRRRPAVHPHAATGTATPPTPATSSRTLQLRDLRVAFGGLVAVDGAGLEAPTGRITGLIGPNGAGKTTTFNACSGLTKPSRGEVTLDGTSLLRYSPSARARRGLGRTFQHMQLFDSLTVRENIALGHEASHAGTNALRHLASSPRTKRNVEKATAEALALCDLTELQDKLAGSLSTGQRRLVELARCLAGPFQILLLDEPSSGLDRAETARFGEILRELVRTRGIGILLVEHDMALVTDICDYVYVLDFGKPIFEGTAAQMLASPTVRAAYLGNDLPPQDPVPARDPATADEEA